MGMPAKLTPTKYCEWCNVPFNRKRVGKNNQLECVANYMSRRFCSISCSVSMQHAEKPKTAAASRKRAMKYAGESCEACGHTEGLVVHHVNGNPMDNATGNLQTLCSPCHSYWHAMLRRTVAQPGKRMPYLLGSTNCAPTETPSSLKSQRSS